MLNSVQLEADYVRLQQRQAECEEEMRRYAAGPAEARLPPAHCPMVWDALLCWPATPAGETAWAPCPDYIYNFSHMNASRQCSSTGAWVGPAGPTGFNDTVTLWTFSNYSECLAETATNSTSVLHLWVPVVKKVAQLGYSVSLCTLILAFVVLFSIKKLRCPRNNLHLHLFASFMLRAAMSLLKDALFVRGVGLPGDVSWQGDKLVFIQGRSNWECKLIISLWQYSIMANYSWILMEGLYLHNLIFLALFSDNSAITLYVALGWGLPASVVLPWVIGRRFLDDEYCWTVNAHDAVYYLVRIPTIITVLVSFALFVNIARVLLAKMQASVQVQRRSMRYKRWARSTMVLVPLFGTHYALLLVFSVGVGHHEVLEVVWLMLDQTFASFQGCLVALLYCLLTREVRVEVRRRWQSTRSAMWGRGGRNSSSRRPGSLLQSAPSLSRPGPGPGQPGQPSRGSGPLGDDLPHQISGRLELQGLADDGLLGDSTTKGIEVQSMCSMAVQPPAKTKCAKAAKVAKACKGGETHSAQSWV